jgi:predicted transcriptional regulator
MSSQILEQLFDSPLKVRIFKLFLRNPNDIFRVSDVANKTQFKQSSVKREVKKLENIGFLNKKRIRSKKKGGGREPGVYYFVNANFDFYSELRNLVLKSSPASIENIFKYIKRLGRVKLAILAGVFVSDENSRLDVFLVGDAIAARRLNNFLRNLEAEVGKAIDYSVMTTDDFNYRFSMFDRFILDILEKPHKKLINKLRI